MAEVIMGVSFSPAWTHRQQRLGALQCLNLAFFIHAENDGILRWTHIKADHIAHLLEKKRIG